MCLENINKQNIAQKINSKEKNGGGDKKNWGRVGY